MHYATWLTKTKLDKTNGSTWEHVPRKGNNPGRLGNRLRRMGIFQDDLGTGCATWELTAQLGNTSARFWNKPGRLGNKSGRLGNRLRDLGNKPGRLGNMLRGMGINQGDLGEQVAQGDLGTCCVLGVDCAIQKPNAILATICLPASNQGLLWNWLCGFRINQGKLGIRCTAWEMNSQLGNRLRDLGINQNELN